MTNLKLFEPVVRSLRVSKVFNENKDRINSIDFSNDGRKLVSSSDDESVVLYDCRKGVFRRTLLSKKYGADLIRFTHTSNAAIHSSTKVDDNLRYLSLHENKYLRYFRGHNKRVISLNMSPIDNTFMSTSLDKTVRIWDLKSPSPRGVMYINGDRPIGNFDPEGLIFAIGYNSEMLNLYDLKSFHNGPFSSFRLPRDPDCDWTGLKFSPNGKTILISTNGNVIYLVDAFQGSILRRFKAHYNTKRIPLEASFSPDSQFVFSGSTDGRVYTWNAETARFITDLVSESINPCHCVQFNPKFMMLASACSSMTFWQPCLDGYN